jgi:hypothetical protein
MEFASPLSSTHGDVDPFAVDPVTTDGVSSAGGGALCLVSRDRVSPVEVAVVEIPVRHRDLLFVAVELESDSSAFVVDRSDGGEVAIEDTEPRSVLETHHPVPGLEHPVAHFQSRPFDESCFSDKGAGALVELVNGGVAVPDEEHFGWVTDGLYVAVPVVDGLVDCVVGGGSDVDPAASVVHADGTVDRPVAEFGEDGSFPVVFLSDVVGEFDNREADGECSVEAAGVDLGEWW